MQERFAVGAQVTMPPLEDVLVVSKIWRDVSENSAFDAERGEAMYELHVKATGRRFGLAAYDTELEVAE